METMSLKIVLSVILALCLTTNAEIFEVPEFTKIFVKEWYHVGIPDNSMFQKSSIAGKKNVFVYQKKENPYDWGTRTMDYTTYYDHIYNNGTISHYECKTHLKAKLSNELQEPYIRTHSGDKVWTTYVDYDRKSIHYFSGNLIHRVTDMKTCEYTESKIYFISNRSHPSYKVRSEMSLKFHLRNEPFIIPHEDGSYELFALNEIGCDGARCRYLVNANGSVSSDITSYLPYEEYSSKTIEFYPTASKDNYFAVVTTKDYKYIWYENYDLTLLYATPGGKIEKLLQLSNKITLQDVDGEYGYITVCWTSGKFVDESMAHVYCLQHNSEKVRTINRRFKFPYEIHTLKVKNLPNGGLILLTEEIEESSVYFITYIQPNGDSDSVIDMIGFDLPESSRVKVINLLYDDNGDDENVCVSAMVEETIVIHKKYGVTLYNPVVKFLRKCFPIMYLVLG